MNNFIKVLLGFQFVFFAFATEAQVRNSKIQPGIGRWELIGSQKVNRNTDWDEFNTGNRSIFSAIKIRVLKSAVNFDRVVINYDNGQKQEISIRNIIQAGGESRVIDLPGNRRSVKSVLFRYQTAKKLSVKAEIQVWGRK